MMNSFIGTLVQNSLIILILIAVSIIYLIFLMNARQMKLSLISLRLKYDEKYEAIQTVEFHKKWIVVTSLQLPTKDIAKLAAIEGWRIVVVGDLKTPSNWSYEGVEFLSIEQQKKFPYRTIENVPYNSYTRKNIGYLYAVHRGARFIYDTDDDNHPTSGQIEFNMNQFTTGLVYHDKRYDVINPYSHFGQPTIWPRGLPLESINIPNNNTYKLCKLKTPTIQQGLVNGDPDVDAIFRLTRKKGPPFNITFDSRTPSLILPQGIFAPFNSQNTLFAYDVFWALFLPTTVSFRVTDIWRGYWAQRLMWLLGHNLSFFPSNAIQIRNVHDYVKDFQDENQVYLESGKVIAFLKKWQCSQNVSFFSCANQLSRDMVDAKFWKDNDADGIEMWFQDLRNIGYEEPIMIPLNSNEEQERSLKIKHETTVYFSPVFQIDQTPNSQTRFNKLLNFCNDYLNSSILLNSNEVVTKFRYENLLLIIVFNNPFHRVIPLLDNLYYEHFPNIVYCGEVTNYDDLIVKMTGKGKFNWIRRKITFIKAKPIRGYFGYECTIKALEMNYVVDGYLIVGDDVLLNFWNLYKVDFTKAAYENLSKEIDRHSRLEKIQWFFWNSSMGYNATNRALDELDEILMRFPSDLFVKHFFDNRILKGFDKKISIDTSDIYYLPRSKRELFLHVVKVFLKHKVFLEITVPTVINGLHSKIIGSLVGKSLMSQYNRNKWNTFYDSKAIYLHPVKLSRVLNNKIDKKWYCQCYIRNYLLKFN